MRQYIINLTGHLIGKNNFDELFRKIPDSEEFVRHVKLALEAGDVRNMTPETLGKIMCSLGVGDVVASKEDLFSGVHFAGDCEEMLRELVSLCLAYAIRSRLDGSCEDIMGAPRWERCGLPPKQRTTICRLSIKSR